MSNLIFQAMGLENYKSFRGIHHFQLHRPPGLYYVTGTNRAAPRLEANGIGKSTLLCDAIYWCLTGETIRAKVPGASVVPWTGGKPTVVALTVLKNGEQQTVTRSRKPNRLFISTDGEEWDCQQHDVDELMGITKEALRRSILVGQFGDLFLEMRPEAQAQMFSDMLNLRRWIYAADQASDLASAAKKSLQSVTVNKEMHSGRVSAYKQQIEAAHEASEQWFAVQAATLTRLLGTVAQSQKALRELKPPKGAKAAAGDLLTRHANAAKSLNLIRGEIARLTTENTALAARKKAYSSAEKTCPDCGQPVTAKHIKDKLSTVTTELAARKDELEDATVSLGEAEESYKKAEAAIRSLNETNEEWSEYEEAKAGLVNDLEAAERQVEGHSKTVDPNVALLARLDAPYLSAQQAEREASQKMIALETERENNEFWEKAFREIRLGLIDECLAELEVTTNQTLEDLGLVGWEIRFGTERENAKGDVSSKFTAAIFPKGIEDPIPWEAYSGGESRRLQLAVTFGLAEVLLARAGISPNIEVLDEPAQHMSASGVDDLLDYLASRAKELRRAIYFIDHESRTKGSFDGLIEIEMTEDGSRILGE